MRIEHFKHESVRWPERWTAIDREPYDISFLTTTMCIHEESTTASTWDQEPIIAGPFESVEAGKAALVLIASSGGG